GAGCGYAFQSVKDSTLLKEGVKKIYVQPIANITYKPGVENLVYNNLVRSLNAYGRVQIVANKELSDAVLEGVVTNATYGSIASAYVSSMQPGGVGATLPTSGFSVAGAYSATLSCQFKLIRTRIKKKGQARVVWGNSFSYSQPFASANQLDVPGATSPLINDSEFDRALTDMAKNMMDDLNNSLVGGF
ncbi:MAG: hypothetical protein HYX41_00840, partial [Bdellovibrio sp.]|nr:hypothetical protein [Bdellovibrio sp.]